MYSALPCFAPLFLSSLSVFFSLVCMTLRPAWRAEGGGKAGEFRRVQDLMQHLGCSSTAGKAKGE